MTRDGCAPGDARGTRVRPRRVHQRERPSPEFGWSRLSRGPKPRRAPTRRPHPGQGGGRRANGLPRRAKLRSGRAGRLPASPAFSSGAGCGRRASARATDRSRRSRGTVVPARASGSPSGKPWQRVGSAGKAPLKLGFAAPAAVEREPTRKQRPARAGTAPREGKALKGDSRDASGMEQGREASGRHGNRRAPQGVRAIRERSRIRREGQEP